MKKLTYKYINQYNNVVTKEFLFTDRNNFGYTVWFMNCKGNTIISDLTINDSQIVKIEEVYE